MINLLPPEEKKGEKPTKKIEEKVPIEMVRPKDSEPKVEIFQAKEIGEKVEAEEVKKKIEIKSDSSKEQKIKSTIKKKNLNVFIIFQKIGQIFRKKAPSSTEKPKEKSRLIEPPTPPGIEVTLMPEEIPITKRLVQERILIFLAVIAVSSLIVFMMRVWAIWQCEEAEIKVNQIKSEMATIEAQIMNYNDEIEEIRKLEKKATRANNLLNNHIYWTKFFKFLEDYTIPDVYYGDFTGDTKGKIVLPAVGRDLIAVARQLVAFSSASEFVKEVTITDLVGGVKGVTFNINLTLNPETFLKK
jgi:hypothetical protein